MSDESKSADTVPRNVVSVSSGGESVTLDPNAQKADQRDEQNNNLTNIANRRVRPTFGIITGARP